jgi:hypothetical protein
VASGEPEPEFASVAWVLRGLFGSGEPCLLQLAGSQLSLVGDDGPVFDVPLTEVEAVFPRYYFSGGVKLRVGGRKYRLSFVRPTNTRAPGVSPARELGRALDGLSDAVTGRQAGKEWRRLLEGG